MRRNLSLSMALMFTFILSAQSDFRKGYIIKNNNDTVYGLIDYNGSRQNAKICTFRNSDDSEEKLYTPEDIESYRFIDGKYYITKTIVLNNTENRVFLEYLINGIVDIYYCRDGAGEHYFIETIDGSFRELKNEEKEFYSNNTSYMKESKEYIGTLRYIFRDSPQTSKEINNVALTHKSLINIAKDYHNDVCKNEECIVYESKIPKKNISFGPIVGYNATTIIQVFDIPDTLYYLYNSNWGYELYPSAGLFFKTNLPFVNEKFFFQYEGMISKRNFNTSNTYFYSLTYNNNISLTQYIFSNTAEFKYNFSNKKLKPSVQLGFSLNYCFIDDYYRFLEVKYRWGDINYTKEFKESPFEKIEYGLNTGVGLTKVCSKNKELFIDIRYQRGFGLLEGFNTNTFLVNMGLQFGI